jgi:nucleotide-binding universal stress UspA family protein
MSYKTILVHVDAGKYAGARLEVALALAVRFDAHLVGLYAESSTHAPSYALAEGGQTIIDAIRRNARERREQAAAAFEAQVKRSGLARTEWRTSDADAAEALALHARYADLLVIGQWASDDPADHGKDLPARVLLGSGRPALVVPYAHEKRPIGERVLVAWNSSREATRAVTDALGFLQLAKKVSVVAFNPRASDGHGAVPGADIATWLARHGVTVEIAQQTVPELDVGNQLLSRAADMSSDLIVMGAYGRSRLQELILGGATRTLLGSMTVPVLMSH